MMNFSTNRTCNKNWAAYFPLCLSEIWFYVSLLCKHIPHQLQKSMLGNFHLIHIKLKDHEIEGFQFLSFARISANVVKVFNPVLTLEFLSSTKLHLSHKSQTNPNLCSLPKFKTWINTKTFPVIAFITNLFMSIYRAKFLESITREPDACRKYLKWQEVNI